MNYKKLTVVPRTAEEIVKIRGCKAFSCYFEGDDWVYYSRGMNELALKKKRIEVESINSKYDYIGSDFYWKREWLKDFREEIDWSKVSIGTPIIVSNCKEAFDNGKGLKRCFAKYENGVVYAWSGEIFRWKYAKLAEEESDEI